MLMIYLLSGDEIEPPDGDKYAVYRIIFDITFFFFVIVILLAIIQGELIPNLYPDSVTDAWICMTDPLPLFLI